MLTDLQQTVQQSALGQKSPYPSRYDKGQLFPVKRLNQRQAMHFPPEIEFFGFDAWNAYELFWLDNSGKPVRAYATFLVPANSANICESKSVKLYLNSLNHERFSHSDDVKALIERDLSEICEAPVTVLMRPPHLAAIDERALSDFRCLDDISLDIQKYQRDPGLLVKAHDQSIGEDKIVSHLFKSHCLCTGQPDLGSIFIDYIGPRIDDAGLLAYLISYRDHAGFSENCIEQIFVDIKQLFKPQKLMVFGRFTRRGGIDINPYRFTHEAPLNHARLVYQ